MTITSYLKSKSAARCAPVGVVMFVIVVISGVDVDSESTCGFEMTCVRLFQEGPFESSLLFC
jgi:hypothetical protein